jgi:hypothetical protein
MEYYRNIKTPENFLRRGSSLYKISELISLTTTPHMLHNEGCLSGEFLKQANY